MLAFLVQVKRLVVRFWLYQDGSIHWLVLIDSIRIDNRIADIDLAEKDATGALLEHAKGAAGDAEVRIAVAVLEALRHVPSIVHFAAFIIAVEERETAI